MSGDNKSAALLRAWLKDGRGKLLHAETGKWLEEHERSSSRWQAQIRAYSQSGVLKIVADSDFESAEESLPKKTKSGEKDKHVIALALAGGARLLYSADGNLRDDFQVIVNRGKIYPGVGGTSSPNATTTVARCRKMLNGGGLCGHRAG